MSAPEGATLYGLRCGWCGAYEGTVDPGEACAQDPNTGEFIGPHEFGIYERVGEHPQSLAPALRDAIRAIEEGVPRGGDLLADLKATLAATEPTP